MSTLKYCLLAVASTTLAYSAVKRVESVGLGLGVAPCISSSLASEASLCFLLGALVLEVSLQIGVSTSSLPLLPLEEEEEEWLDLVDMVG